MSYKRSRATYEADLHAPYATFGTPLPDETDARDDGSYLPLWKQEVRDERGRKRLHGAFTGGWSAGYFNTVGSKEGWTPSTFVSSRNNRRKDGTSKATQQQHRPEDYMDDEDLADAAEAQQLQTSQAFAGLGSGTQNELGTGGLMGLFKIRGDTTGLKLLRKMGWKDGQGIGPKVRRSARLDMAKAASSPSGQTYLFAPDNARMIRFVRKTDRKGLGHQGEAKLASLGSQITSAADEDDDIEALEESDSGRQPAFSLGENKPRPTNKRGGIGVGILNDDGSDEEDPYEIGPKIRYNRTIKADKKRKSKKINAVANPKLGSTPTFVPRTARAGNGLRRCHDGRLPLDGFVLARITEDLSSLLLEYAPPPVPEGWKSSKTPANGTNSAAYMSTAEAAKGSTHDPRSRAAILGEKSLPGKSVFDYISSSARDRLVVGSGRKDLPQGLGEIPAEFALTEEQRQQALWDRAPSLDRETAVAAISRGSGGPYSDNEAKKARYRTYLEHFATGSQPLPSRPERMSDEDFLRELNEFYNCARIFKPMTGFMASRFTTAKTKSSTPMDGNAGAELLSQPEAKVTDPAEEAAKLGMYGKMTRSAEDFFPTRLLCKRFNVRPPAHSRQEHEPEGSAKGADAWSTFERAEGSGSTPPSLAIEAAPSMDSADPAARTAQTSSLGGARIDPEKNDAVEGKTAHDEEAGSGPSASSRTSSTCSSRNDFGHDADLDTVPRREQSPPPQYPASEASLASRPPPFSSLFSPPSAAAPSASPSLSSLASVAPQRAGKFPAVAVDDEAEASGSVAVAAPAYESTQEPPFHPDRIANAFAAETKRALPRDTKAQDSSSRKDDADAEPPPAYSEGDSPLFAFSYLMAAAGGASSIITQVQQGGPPVNAIGDVGADETIAMDLRGTRFYLSRDELLTLPEFVLLSLFPNGLFPEGQMGGFSEGEAVQVDYDPVSLQYMLDFFRNVAQTIPSESSPSASQDGDVVPIEPMGPRDDSSKRAGIIVLREDLDFYAIPPRQDISQLDMIEVKRAAARALQQQDGIFSGLKRSDEPGTTEAHLIEMLTAGGFNHDDRWGHRAGEPNKAVICSLALARLRSDIRGNDMGNSAVGMAQKLLLFWRKPARRCWWEGVELEGIDGVEGKLKVWIRRVWTLEMSVIGLR